MALRSAASAASRAPSFQRTTPRSARWEATCGSMAAQISSALAAPSRSSAAWRLSASLANAATYWSRSALARYESPNFCTAAGPSPLASRYWPKIQWSLGGAPSAQSSSYRRRAEAQYALDWLGAAPRGAAPSQSSAYWASARRRYELLCADGAPPKLHWIFGQYLEASGDGPAAVQKFGDSYRASAERDQYVAAFASEAESLHAADDLEGAAKALEICAAIEPHVASHLADLGVVRWKLGALDAAEAALRRAIFNQGAVEAQAALRAALSLVLADLGRGAEAAEEERLARQGHPETAAAALEHLATLRR
mmetsp:Transcript_17128/g.59580  ORF Transcript_17128/g.59580 Transcript_17128/m.59580 type:complete len:310 (+) Transcript_17128:500-1429(+)